MRPRRHGCCRIPGDPAAGACEPPVAGFRRPDAGRDRLVPWIHCGPTADQGAVDELNPQLKGLRRTSWPVSRILFRLATVDRGRAAATIHLGTPSPGASSGLPAGSGEQPSDACAAAPGAAFWPCFGWGLPSHPGHPGCWCALTAPFHPYHPAPNFGVVAVCFLWHCPASHLGLPLAITLLCEVRTFLDSPGEPRPPGQLVRVDKRTAWRACSASGDTWGILRWWGPHHPRLHEKELCQPTQS